MTQLSPPLSGTKASRRFQPPPGSEKRTQASTLFSTSAKNLTSSVPFRWRAEQVDIFEDWIVLKGPNAMSADLVPLLRELDLDGYEDIDNEYGECVHDLIIEKVRRKLARTKSALAAAETEAAEEVKEERQAPAREIYKKPPPPPPTTTTTTTMIQRDHRRAVVAPLSPPLSAVDLAREPATDARYASRETTPIKLEKDPGVFSFRFGADDYDKPAAAAAAAPVKIPIFTGLPDPVKLPAPPTRATTRTGTTQLSPPPPPSPLPPPVLLPSTRMSHNTSTLATPAPAPAAVERRAAHQLAPPPCHESRPERVVLVGRTGAGGRLAARLQGLESAMDALSLEIGGLPGGAEAAALDTAAHDAGLEIRHLGDLIGEYVTR
ncbi:hypothetical protein SAMD00023353_10000180 [Rosellinia necatrix]|uniref:Uncharacterized protein n=1 Tax=Rosellinia necatrix TaxID=77044 RepID=A0A1W2TWK5_ROSNE|nr:hypothetical protein SAMD00023353_10000180 [Rosellinia necatrix]